MFLTSACAVWLGFFFFCVPRDLIIILFCLSLFFWLLDSISIATNPHQSFLPWRPISALERKKEKGKKKAKTSQKKKEEEKNWKEKGHANNNKTSIYLRLPNSSTAVHTRSPIVILSTCSPAPTILAVAVAAPMSREENALIVCRSNSVGLQLCRRLSHSPETTDEPYHQRSWMTRLTEPSSRTCDAMDAISKWTFHTKSHDSMTVPPAGTRILFRGRLPHAFPELPIYIQTSTTSTTPQPVYDRVDCDLRKSTFDYARSPWLADHPLLTRRRRSLISYLPLTLLNWKIERTGLWTDWTQSQGAGGYLIIPSLLFLFFSFLFFFYWFYFILLVFLLVFYF